MTRPLPPTLAALAAANPVPADERLGLIPDAQAALARILASERDPASGRRRASRRRVIAIAVVATVLAGCGALRVADPFGFWRSSAPGAALYGVNPALHVTAPRAADIGCARGGAATLSCTAGAGGVRYRLISRVHAVVPFLFTRANLLHLLATAPAEEASAAEVRRLRADIEAVPDSFFAAWAQLSRFQTLESSTAAPAAGMELVPPRGMPLLLTCERLPDGISCRDLNGDEQTPVGSGIYGAVPAPDWVAVPSRQAGAINALGERMVVAALGHPFTAAELRLELDLARSITPAVVHRHPPVVRGRSATSSTASSG